MKFSMKTAAAGAIVATILTASVTPSTAGEWRGWPAAGVGFAAGALLGAAIAQPYRGYYGGYYGYGYRGYYNDHYPYPLATYSYPYDPSDSGYGCCYRRAYPQYRAAYYPRVYYRQHHRWHRWYRYHGW